LLALGGMGQLLSHRLVIIIEFSPNSVSSLVCFLQTKRMGRIKSVVYLFLLWYCLASIAQPFLNFVNAQKAHDVSAQKTPILPSQFRAFVARAAPISPTVSSPLLQQRQLRDSANDVNFVGIAPGLSILCL
jgi:hypothetical protein